MPALKRTNDAPALGGPTAWLVWVLAALCFGYAFFHRVAPSVMVSDLMRDFSIGAGMLGTLSALYFYPYVLLQIPLGALLDRFGTRLLLTIAMMIAALGSILFAMADSLYIAYLGRIMIGIGSSVGFLGSLALAAKWFPQNRFAFLAGLSMLFAMLSGMAAQAPLALLVEEFGWRSAMISLAVAGGIFAVLVFLLVRDSPKNELEEVGENPNNTSVWSGLMEAAKSIQVWKVAFVAATMSGPMLALGALWGTPYLMVAYELERPQAAFLVSLLLLGWAFGAPFNGWLSDHIGKRKLLLVCGSAVLSLAVGVISLVPSLPMWLCVAMLIIAGFAGSAMSVTFALAREVVSSHVSSSATGIVNSMTVASGAVLQPVVGLLLDSFWNGEMVEGARFYLAGDYRASFIIICGSAIAGFLVACTLPENPLKPN